MKVYRDLHLSASPRGRVVTVGVFDGLHLGHQLLLSALMEDARLLGVPGMVISFTSHPQSLLSGAAPLLLTTLGEKESLLEELGVNELLLLDFTRELAELDAEDFIAGTLIGKAGMRELVLGPDFAMGRRRMGDSRLLQHLASQYAFSLRGVEPALMDGSVVSSTRVRGAVSSGDMAAAAAMLGRFYAISGPVVRGRGAGSRLGYPTANLQTAAEKLLPPDGVYAGYVPLAEKRLRAVVNIGCRPTFDNGRRTVEIHIPGFSGDLYGRALKMLIVARLRSEEAFSDPLLLREEIAADIRRAEEMLPLT